MTELINVDIYDRDVVVHCGGVKPLRKFLSKFLPQEICIEVCNSLYDSQLGRTIEIKNSGVLVYLPKEPTDAKSLSILIHELFHATYIILQKAGIDCNDSADEAYAYLLGFLAEKTIKALSFSLQQ